MLPIDKWFSPSEKGKNTASLAFKSRFAFSVGIHVTLLAGVSAAKRERAMSRVFQCKKWDAIWTRVMLLNLECFSCKNAYVMQGCRARTGAVAAAPLPALGTKLFQRAGTICSEPKSESDIKSGAAIQLRERLSATHIKRIKQRQAWTEPILG